MTATQLITDSFVSLAAFAGLLLAIAALRRPGRADPLTGRFVFGLSVVAVLMGARVVGWNTHWHLFDALYLIAAALIPLATLIVVEGLLRRHAPLALKLAALVGAVGLGATAILPPAWVEPGLGWALALFQVAGFVAVGALVVLRDRSALSSAENRTVDRLALSLILIVPLTLTDYGFAAMPVRLSGIAILFLCWLALTVGRGQVSHRDAVASFTAIAAGAVLSGLAIGWVADLSWTAIAQAIAIVLATMLVVLVFNETRGMRREDRRASLLRQIAYGDTGDVRRFLRDLQRHTMVEGGLLLEEGELGDVDPDVLRRVFEHSPVCRPEDAGAQGDPAAAEQLHWLFEKYGATHILLVQKAPLTLLVLNLPTLAASPGLQIEVRAVQRMASLIADREAAA